MARLTNRHCTWLSKGGLRMTWPRPAQGLHSCSPSSSLSYSTSAGMLGSILSLVQGSSSPLTTGAAGQGGTSPNTVHPAVMIQLGVSPTESFAEVSRARRAASRSSSVCAASSRSSSSPAARSASSSSRSSRALLAADASIRRLVAASAMAARRSSLAATSNGSRSSPPPTQPRVCSPKKWARTRPGALTRMMFLSPLPGTSERRQSCAGHHWQPLAFAHTRSPWARDILRATPCPMYVSSPLSLVVLCFLG
mmetsp:Transcript_71544/g.225948  ORF Transcript_71544/g.225948 Transcript_71544/m.225948 type:complete len:252 (-) Transcript_71544:305-1060(-)